MTIIMTNETFTLKGKNLPAGVTVDLAGELGYDMFGNGLYVGICEVLGSADLPEWATQGYKALEVLTEGDTYTVPVFMERDYSVVA